MLRYFDVILLLLGKWIMRKGSVDKDGMDGVFSSNEVYKILEQNPQGSIHSVFTNSFNIAFDKSLVHVGVYEMD